MILFADSNLISIFSHLADIDYSPASKLMNISKLIEREFSFYATIIWLS